MNLSVDRSRIKCHICNEWKYINTQIYVDGDTIKCLECDATLGYTTDLPEIFDKPEEK